MPGDARRRAILSRDHLGNLGRDAEKRNNTRNHTIAICPPFYRGDVYIIEGNLNLLRHFLTVDVVLGIRAWNPRFFICEKRAPIESLNLENLLKSASHAFSLWET